MSRRAQQLGSLNESTVKAFYLHRGCQVYRVGRPGIEAGRKGNRGSMMTPGVPDFIVFHLKAQKMWLHEAKAGSGRLNPDQREFKAHATTCGIPVVVGDWRAGAEYLEQLGLYRCERDRHGQIISTAPCQAA